MSDPKLQNVYQRINDIRKAISYIQKDKSVSTGKSSYKAVTHDAVTAMVRAHMIEHGVVCVPSLIESSMNVATPATAERGAMYRYEARYRFTFTNIDDPQDCIAIEVQSHAMDNADKAPGKAISYAKKYAVLKLFEIETGEDEESRYAHLEAETMPADELGQWMAELKGKKTKKQLRVALLAAVKDAASYGDAAASKRFKEEAVRLSETLPEGS